MHYEVADQIQDNLRNLMMTNPGERLGRPDYGAGLRELTMEMLATDDFESILMNRIKMTVDKYLPIVELSNFTLEDITTEAYTLQSSMAKVEVIIDYNVPRFQIINKKLAITLFVAG
jgi:phage baseplate assembly protein W